MFDSVPLSKNRLAVYNLMERAKKYHCTITSAYEWDITDTLARIEALRAQGEDIGMAAFMVKATSRVLEMYPKLNQRLFHQFFGKRIVTFDQISCNLIVTRKRSSGEEVLFPIVVRNSNKKSTREIHRLIREFKTTREEDLEEIKKASKVRGLPRVALRYIDYKFRSDPRFFIQHAGTYSMSAMVHEGSGVTGGALISPSTTFYPTAMEDRAAVYQGQVAVRKMMVFGLAVDHYVVDGLYVVRAAKDLKKLIEDPSWLLDEEYADATSASRASTVSP